MKRYKTERQYLSKTLLRDGDYSSIREMILRIAKEIPEKEILCELDREKKRVTWTAKQLCEEVMHLGEGFLSEGLGGAHIAIVADNSSRYLISDIAISCGVGVVTPIDVEATPELLGTLLRKCDADAVLCSARCLENIRKARAGCPRLKTLITIDKRMEGCLFYDDMLAGGAALAPNGPYHTLELDLDAPVKILFTSGTTGPNKGVVLTQRNLAANMMNCLDTVKRSPGRNVDLAVLPMHHAIEINTHIMARVGAGHLTCINGNLKSMMNNIKIFQPETITVVPMIINVFYRTIWNNAEKAGKADKLRKGIKLAALCRKFGFDITHRIFKEVYAPFGGNLNMIVCGGSMLNPNVVKGMNDLGIRVENGYGITECGPLISMNADPANDIFSVGKAAPRFEVKISSPDADGVGELCVKGPSVSKGYYKDEEATREVFYPDGFFNTGDSARLDPDGRIVLFGRKKNTIILENGKNVCPEEVENTIETSLDYAAESIVYQAEYRQSRKYLTAMVWIPDDSVRTDTERIAADICRMNDTLPVYKRIDYVELAASPLERTASKKLIRTAVPAECSGKGIEII